MSAYTCAGCNRGFERISDDSWDDEKAMAEMRERFGELPESERVTLCDDCWKRLNRAAVQTVISSDALRRHSLATALYNAFELLRERHPEWTCDDVTIIVHPRPQAFREAGKQAGTNPPAIATSSKLVGQPGCQTPRELLRVLLMDMLVLTLNADGIDDDSIGHAAGEYARWLGET